MKPVYPVLHLDLTGQVVVPPQQQPSILVFNDRVVLHDGTEIKAGLWGQPLQAPLAEACRRAKPNAVIGVYGDVQGGASFGAGADAYKPDVVSWGEQPVHDLTIQGMTPDARLHGLSFGSSLGGAFNLLFRELTVQSAAPDVYCPVTVNMGSVCGALGFINCKGEGFTDSWGPGFDTRFGFIRAHGQCQIYMVNVIGASALEHGVAYTDNLQGPSRIHNCTSPRVGRTLNQHTNRVESGAAAFGDLAITGLHFTGEHFGYDGGSLVTVVGLGGDLYLHDIDLQPKGTEFGGGIAVWADADHGLYLDKDGYATQRVFLHKVNANCPNQKAYAAIAVSGMRELWLADVQAHGGDWGLWCKSPFSSNLAKTGAVRLANDTTQNIVGQIRWAGDKNSAALPNLAALVAASKPVIVGGGTK